MWFIGVEVEQETSAAPPKNNPGSALQSDLVWNMLPASDDLISQFCYGFPLQ